MKTFIPTAAVAFLAIVIASPSSDASDLSQLFQRLEATQHISTPGASVTPSAVAPVAPRLLLGAWLTDVEGKLQVTGTVPGSPASQSLQAGDVLYRITTPEGRTQTLRTMNQFEYAKRQAGPNRPIVLQVYRPGVGVIPMEVTFATQGGLATVALSQPVPSGPTPTADPQGLVSR
jgi:hypothetical protein